MLEEYLKSSPYVMSQLKDAEVDPLELHRAIVNISDRMKAVNDAQEKTRIKRLLSPDIELHCADS